jgi:hypothetical protein
MKPASEKSYASGATTALIIAILLVTFPDATGSRIFCILKLGDECILSGLQTFDASVHRHRASGSESMTHARHRGH